jgi:hypothetical protein
MHLTAIGPQEWLIFDSFFVTSAQISREGLIDYKLNITYVS